jgi:hypothetical protein
MRVPCSRSATVADRSRSGSLAHLVGLFRKGVDLDEIRADHPASSEADLGYASLLAHVKADPGRPRKALTLLSAPKPASASRRKDAAADR